MTKTSTHQTVNIFREGASLRTADELSVLFVEDAVSLGAELSPWGQETLTDVKAQLSRMSDGYSDTAWLHHEGLEMDLATLVNQMETELYTLGLTVEWEDGYSITDYSNDEDERHPDDEPNRCDTTVYGQRCAMRIGHTTRHDIL